MIQKRSKYFNVGIALHMYLSLGLGSSAEPHVLILNRITDGEVFQFEENVNG